MSNTRSAKTGLSRRQFMLASVAGSLSLFSLNGLLAYADTPHEAPLTEAPSSTTDNVHYINVTDDEYDQYRQPFNKRIDLKPRVIAVCLNETGVQEAMQLARVRQLPVAIKSGGHSLEGYCLNDGGMVIELSRLNTMTYDPAKERFYTGPGSKLGQVYEYLAQYGRLIPAGSCAGVGISGLTLGGGYGFFSRQFGLTCDSLIRVRVVDGHGMVHDSDQNPELLWASRGGGNGNFGIITALEFRTHPAPAQLRSYRFQYRRLKTPSAITLAEEWFLLMKQLPESSYSAFVLGRNGAAILIIDAHDHPTPDLQNILNRLAKRATTVIEPHTEPLLTALRFYEGGIVPRYFKNCSAGYFSDFEDLRTILSPLHRQMKAQSGTLLQINTLGGAIENPALEETAAYPHRRFPFLGELQAYWDDPSHEASAVETIQNLQSMLQAHGIHSHYSNYPNIGLANWQEAYYGRNYERLQALKRKLDPEDRIHHPQSVRVA
ncbi:MAG: FAD-binding oxidoreductase [Nitrospira sp.]|nr:FAD-binding oxidoreductase [Nitrospira sp.]